jgi:hypothetical protein
MGRYRFDLIGEAGAVTQSQVHVLVDDLAALDLAECMCARNAVDVWDGARRVLRVKRQNAMATPSDRFPG